MASAFNINPFGTNQVPLVGGSAMTNGGTDPNMNLTNSGSASGGGLGSNLTPTSVGPQESLLDQLFSGSVTGHGGGPIAQQLFSLGQGILPKPMQDMITGTTNDQFGRLGARFGTDLGTA